MEHDLNCEKTSIMLSVSVEVKLTQEEKDFLLENFCLCGIRRDGERTRADQVQEMGRMAWTWWRLHTDNPDWGLPFCLNRARDVIWGKVSLAESGLDLPEEIIEVDFRRRARIMRRIMHD